MRLSVKVVLCILFDFCYDYVCSVRNVVINIEPPIVERGGSALLRCDYDLEGKPLYSIKWYRGHHEFYRYTLNEIPQVFPFDGLQVNLELSDEHQVVLDNVDFNLSGTFTCEVSADSPNFPTAILSRNMSVVVLPEHPPTLITEKKDYEVGDMVRANCTSAPSKPPATLSFNLNGIVVATKHEHRIPVSKDLWISHASTEFQLFESHFREASVYLHCLAQVTNLYQQDTHLRLDNLKDPVPEKVMLSFGLSIDVSAMTVLYGSLILLFV